MGEEALLAKCAGNSECSPLSPNDLLQALLLPDFSP